jgi:hypothetical protein
MFAFGDDYHRFVIAKQDAITLFHGNDLAALKTQVKRLEFPLAQSIDKIDRGHASISPSPQEAIESPFTNK